MSNCCAEPTGLAALADNSGIVVTAYLAAFFPWGLLQALDFISPRWHKLRNTRRKGYFHLAVSIPPMGFVIFYTHLQRLSGDFKEMSAAIAAVILNLIHITRTVWGLVQLQAFHAWCCRALACVERMGCYALERRATGALYDRVVETHVDYKMRVNETLLDNEFFEADLPVRLTHPTNGWIRGLTDLLCGRTEDWLFCIRPVACNVRWLASFLCQFGARWSMACRMDGRAPFSAPAAEVLQVQAFLQVTADMPDGGGGGGDGVAAPGGVELRSFLQPLHHFLFRLVPDMQAHVFAYSCALEKRSVYQIANQRFNLSDALNNYDIRALDHMKIDAESVLNDISLANVQAFMSLLDEQRPDWGAFRDHVAENPLWGELLSDAVPVAVFLAQLGLPHGADLDDALNGIPVPKDLCSSLLWGAATNRALLQASAHLDNLLALKAGRILADAPAPGLDPAAKPHYVFHVHEKMEAGRASDDDQPQDRLARHFGVVLETVRSALASWLVSTGRSGAQVDWNPALPAATFEFRASSQLFGCLHKFPMDRYAQFSVSARVVWECQAALQAAVARGAHGTELQGSAELIMLCVLAFPALRIKQEEPEEGAPAEAGEIGPLVIDAVHAPQDVQIAVAWDTDTRGVALRLVAGEGVTRFHWENWKNAAKGRLSGQYKRVRNEESSPGDLVRFVDARWTLISRPMINVQVPHKNIKHLDSNLSYWIGWPPAYPRIARFEIDQLVPDLHSSSVKKSASTTSIEVGALHDVFRAEIDGVERALNELGAVFDYDRASNTGLSAYLRNLEKEAIESESVKSG